MSVSEGLESGGAASALEQPCTVCSTVPLQQLHQGFNAKPIWFYLQDFNLLGDIQCNFCRLVHDAIHQDPGRVRGSNTRGIQKQGDLTLALKWSTSYAPGRRAGLQLSGETCDAWLAFGTPGNHPGRMGRNDNPTADEQRLYLRDEVEPVVDLDRMKRWISHCETNHPDCGQGQATRIPNLPKIRLIDVTNNVLVEMSEIPKYVALSYVWGAVPNFRLTTANRSRLMQPGAIEEAMKYFPMTIRDAIILTRRLSGRYLWVDSLCLLQNDEEDLRQGVNVMDHIFEQSWLTIIGACGHDADGGLIGLHPGDRAREQLLRRVRPGVFMGLCFGLDMCLRGSVYESRAWTFQEHLLSRRTLYFVDGRLFFRCRQGLIYEIWKDDPEPNKSPSFVTPLAAYQDPIKPEYPLQNYAWMLEQYTQRSLTKDADISRALQGIMRRVSEKLDRPIIEGLPTTDFVHFMTFSGRNLRRRAGFPSYSWVGWQGAIGIIEPFLYAERRQPTWIRWYISTGSGIYTPVLEKPEFRVSLPESFQPHLSNQVPYIAVHGTQLITYPTLRFWSLTIQLKLNMLNVFKTTAKLVGGRGLVIGEVTLDGLEDTKFFESQEPCELVILSEATVWNWALYKDFDKQDGTLKVYHVMLLEWKLGVAERRGIGTIAEVSIREDALPPGPQWKEIILA